MPPPMAQAGSPGLAQMLAALSSQPPMPSSGPVGGPPEMAEGEGQNPLLMLLMQLLAGSGGGQGMPVGGGGMSPQGGGGGY